MSIHTFNSIGTPVANFTFEQFIELFKTATLDISTFWLINCGFDEAGNKKYAHVILRACSIRPFFGPHLVSVFNNVEGATDPEMKTFWVHSLTYLRKDILLFKDRLSFERSTFLMPFGDDRMLIRIKSIRTFLSLPKPAVENAESEKEDQPIELGVKRKTFLNQHIQSMISYLNRECSQSSLDSVNLVKEYIVEYCDELKTNLESI